MLDLSKLRSSQKCSLMREGCGRKKEKKGGGGKELGLPQLEPDSKSEIWLNGLGQVTACPNAD